LHAEAATIGAAAGGSTSSTPLTTASARPVVDQAIAAWQSIDPRAAGALDHVEVIVSDLPQTVLGLSSPTSNTIWLDVNGGGHGWQITGASSSTPGGMDLMTVISHELGHVLGLADLDASSHAGDLMSSRLNADVSRSPADSVFGLLRTFDAGVSSTDLLSVSQSLSLSGRANLSDSMFSSLGRSGLQTSLRPAGLDLLAGDGTLDDDDEEVSLLTDESEVELERVAADRQSLAKRSGQERVAEDREFDKLLEQIDRVFGDFDARLLEE
jgi:hypothetical protein